MLKCPTLVGYELPGDSLLNKGIQCTRNAVPSV